MTSEQLFLRYASTRLEQMAGRVATCLDKLTAEQIWTRNSDNENAIGNLVLHLCGNLRQYVGFGVAGLPDIRVRDREFSARGGMDIAELKERLLTTVRESAGIVAALPPGRLTETTTVQAKEWTVLEVVFLVVEHFGIHFGQIVYATKLWTGADLGFSQRASVTAPGQVP
jgi:hypothetical protein